MRYVNSGQKLEAFFVLIGFGKKKWESFMNNKDVHF